MRRLLLLALALGLGACAHEIELRPAPGAPPVAGRPAAAETTVAGVRVIVDGDAWRGPSLDGRLTPVQVTLENHSGHPLRLRYDAFGLLTADNLRLAALPPMQVAARAQLELAPLTPRFTFGGFWVAPWYAPYYPGIPPWAGPMALDVDSYGLYSDWPSEYRVSEILDQAIPEGVLGDGGHVSGFIYFQGLKGRGPQVTFEGDLVDATTGQDLGQAHLPFLVTRNGKPLAQR